MRDWHYVGERGREIGGKKRGRLGKRDDERGGRKGREMGGHRKGKKEKVRRKGREMRAK